VPLVISKTQLWPKIGYVPNRAQRVMHADHHRFQVTAAGRRTGKSTAGGHDLLPEAYRAYLHRAALTERDQRMEYWLVGPQYTDSEKEFRRFYNACKRLKMPFDKPGTYYDQRGGDMQVSLWGGRFMVTAQSARYPEHLVGEGLSGVILCEAAKMKKLIWEKYLRPTLADFRGWGKFTSTPEGRNWFYDLWRIGQNGTDPEWSSHRFPSWANEMIFPLGREDPEILSMMKGMSEELAKQEIAAEFSAYVGQVFKDWDEEWHVRASAEYRPEWPLYLATDYGWTNPSVALFIQVDPFDRVQLIDEYYQTHRSPEEFAADLLSGAQSAQHPSLIARATHLYPDPEDPGASHALAEKLRLKIMGNTGGEIKPRLELIRKWLKDENPHLDIRHPDRRPKFVAHPRCHNFIREMDAYRYPATAGEQHATQPEKPLKQDDHCPEALGRFFAGHYGAGAVRGSARVRRGRYARSRRAGRGRVA
jgi:hypothetical protein